MEEENSWLDTDTVVHKNIKSVRPEYKKKINKLENVEKNPTYVDALDSEKYSELLKVLLDEFSTDLPTKSKKFATEHFGEDWLKALAEDIENIKWDLKHSKLFPPQTSMIFLKYIFLLKQNF